MSCATLFLKDALELTDANGQKVFSIVKVAQMAGHESIQMTMRYTLSSEEEINEKINNLYSD